MVLQNVINCALPALPQKLKFLPWLLHVILHQIKSVSLQNDSIDNKYMCTSVVIIGHNVYERVENVGTIAFLLEATNISSTSE